jgi:hypothetical protein
MPVVINEFETVAEPAPEPAPAPAPAPPGGGRAEQERMIERVVGLRAQRAGRRAAW